MASVLIPARKQNPVSGLLPIAGAAVGTYYGGPAGGAAGSAIGGQAAGAMAGKDAPAVQSAQIENPMARRSQAMEDDPHQQLIAAYAALDKMPKELREQYKEPLGYAVQMSLEERQRGYA